MLAVTGRFLNLYNSLFPRHPGDCGSSTLSMSDNNKAFRKNYIITSRHKTKLIPLFLEVKLNRHRRTIKVLYP